MLFTASHSVLLGILLIGFAVALVFAGIIVFELRKTSDPYNARLFTFGYLSLAAWILWELQYAILVVPILFHSRDFSRDNVLWLGAIQNVLWACAVLSLHFARFSRKSLRLPDIAILAIIVGVVTYKARILTSDQFTQFITPIDGVLTAVFFLVVGIWIVQLRHSKIYAAVFLIHGFTQWIWTWRWLTSFSTDPFVQLGFPLSRVALLIAWIKLTSEMVQRAQPAARKFAQVVEPKLDSGNDGPKLPKLVAPLKVMISSTVDDLVEEREAVDRAIRELKLTRFRAETFGSVPHSPKVICALLAEQCDIFVLIIGERPGYMIESEGISVVEFEFQVARAQNREKILVYVKDGVDRDHEPLLKEFLNRVEHFEEGYFRTLFTTPDDLHNKVQGDVARWLRSK
jgi:hypothetical protein